MASPHNTPENFGISTKRAVFVREYLIDLNATQAAIRAGYSPKTANEQAARMLAIASVKEAVASAMREREARTEITQDRVLREVGRLAFLDISGAFAEDGSLKALADMDPETRAAIAGLEVSEQVDAEGNFVGHLKKIKLSDKIGALTLLMRHLGMLNDKIKVAGDVENPLTLLVKSIQGSAVKPIAKPLPDDGGM
ncbi:terminase small subunit [Xanthobacter sp. DSM 24535]|uniref:terminase small subunit n=1 Tax=Roseixanthobacter psychrophilus TaxID=3119917 RepID=UPI003728958D